MICKSERDLGQDGPMFLNRPLNSTVKWMAETCIRGLRMEGVNTVFANFNENWYPGGLSCVDREMSRFAAHIRPYKLEGPRFTSERSAKTPLH